MQRTRRIDEFLYTQKSIPNQNSTTTSFTSNFQGKMQNVNVNMNLAGLPPTTTYVKVTFEITHTGI